MQKRKFDDVTLQYSTILKRDSVVIIQGLSQRPACPQFMAD